MEHFREFLIGRNPMQIGRIWQELYRSQYFEGGRVLLAAQSAIDIALHDIKAKALGVPVYDLLGGKQRDRIPTFASTPSLEGQDAIDIAKTLIKAGWSTIRFTSCCSSGIRSPGRPWAPNRRCRGSRTLWVGPISIGSGPRWPMRC